MATTLYTENLKNAALHSADIQQWFEAKGFTKAVFEANKSELYIDGVLHNVQARDGYDTYLKADVGGSILVFEVKLLHTSFECICYAPVLLFGFINIKISFKEKASAIAKYRQHGYEYLMELQNFVRKTIVQLVKEVVLT